jgi:transcriptional regulator with XRE-family HTH domain
MLNKAILIEKRADIGIYLRKLRLERKIGTKKLSLSIGMSETQVLDIEFNRRNYTIDNFLKYIQALNMSFIISEK